ncbi:hypothetical protein C8R45DRAFT_923706 [Mycena sanguinolenta]|nr:hypothetical protein C8R45DRAFT_923706 [Mycena sanguinolenta]
MFRTPQEDSADAANDANEGDTGAAGGESEARERQRGVENKEARSKDSQHSWISLHFVSLGCAVAAAMQRRAPGECGSCGTASSTERNDGTQRQQGVCAGETGQCRESRLQKMGWHQRVYAATRAGGEGKRDAARDEMQRAMQTDCMRAHSFAMRGSPQRRNQVVQMPTCWRAGDVASACCVYDADNTVQRASGQAAHTSWIPGGNDPQPASGQTRRCAPWRCS